MMNENWALTELPKGWLWTDFESISRELKAGGTPLTKIKKYYDDGNIPFVKIEDIVDSSKYLYDTKTRITEQGLRNSSAWLVPRDSLLYSMYASYGEPIINKIEVATSQAIIAYIPPQGLIVLDYVYYYLKKIRTELTTRGTTQKNLNAQIVKHIPIPLAPFNEQVRIVAKLEELFTSLDAGVEGLRKVKAQLKRYGQAVLKYAFEGKLTEEWRKAHKDQIEPTQKLLERIRRERRQSWEQNLRTLGRDPRKQRYKEAVSADAETLPSLPIEWTYASADELSVQITDGEHVTPRRQENGIYLLSARNVLDGRLVLDDVDFIPNDEYERIKRRLNPETGDVLLSCSGSVGRTCVVPEGIKFSMVRSVALLKPIRKLVSGEYMSLALRSDILQGQINRKKTQTAQANIFQGKIKTLTFPLAPFPEQNQIVEEIERRFSVADEVEEMIEQISTKAGRLRQSILKKAFEGRLGSQDPSDEPADKLLQRIREERAKSKGEKDTNKKKIKPKQLELSSYVK
jgi:type I restriction enzyme S subunit